MALGIDEQVQQRVDANRGNPKALMDSYQRNQQLIDLLALQKLKAEKEAAARDMQMKMQQQPGTIKEQREKQLMDMTKNELASQTGKLMAQRQAQQQKNLSRVAAGGLKGLQGQPSAQNMTGAQGIAGITPQNRPRMAGGGIVAFQPGGEVQSGTPLGRWWERTTSKIGEDLETQRLRQRVRTKYAPYAAPIGGLFQQTDDQRAYAQKIVDAIDSGQLTNDELLQLEQGFPTFSDDSALENRPEVNIQSAEEIDAEINAGDPEKQKVVTEVTAEETPPAEVDPNAVGAIEGITSGQDLTINAPVVPVPTQSELSPEMKTAQTEALAGLRGLATTDVVAPKMTVPERGELSPEMKALGQQIQDAYAGLAGTDPKAVAEGLRADSDAYFDRAGKAATYDKQVADFNKLIEEQQDPDKLKNRRIMAALTAPTTGRGLGGGTVGRAVIGERLKQEQEAKDALLKRFDLEDKAIQTDLNIAKEGQATFRTGYKEGAADRRSGISGLGGLYKDAQGRLDNQQKMEFEAGRYNQLAEISAQEQSAANKRQGYEGMSDIVNTEINRLSKLDEANWERNKENAKLRLDTAEANALNSIRKDTMLFNSVDKLINRVAEVNQLLTEARRSRVALDPQLQELYTLRDSTEIEDEDELKEVNAKIARKEEMIEALLVNEMASLYGLRKALNTRILQLESAMTTMSPQLTTTQNANDFNDPVQVE
jgi:hypothetical protein